MARRKTKPLPIGNVVVGGDAPIVVQSMTNTKTADVAATLRQVYALTDADAADDLPDADALADWFRFLATACPECGVIDDPMLSGPTL